MATQTKGPTRPASRRRSAGEILAGLAAIAVLLVLLAGVPVALITVFGLPMPHGMPSVSLFTHPLQASAVLMACAVVVWLAWLQFVWCVVAEVSAALRNTGMPARVPLAGAIQPLVHRLVTAALLLATAAAVVPALAPVAASAAVRPAQAGVTSSAAAIPGQMFAAAAPVATNGAGHAPGAISRAVGQGHQPGADGPSLNGTDAARAAPDAGAGVGAAQRTEKIYVVRPPAGRFHESLWEIAETHLGDGRRYREIFELNKDKPQPDGSKLTIASLIRPGWILRMPHDAYGPGIEVVKVRPPGRHHRPAAQHTPAPAPKNTAPATHKAAAPAIPRVPATATPAPAGAPGHTASSASSHPAAPPSASSHPAAPPHRSTPASAAPHSASPGYPLELAAAGLLAAGVLAALERRRRKQSRRRPYRRQVAAPQPDAAWAELALRLGEDEAAAQMLDAGLRYLCHALSREDRTPPTVFAVHVGEENLDLWVAPASHDAPAPWYPVGDGQVWRLALVDAPRLDLGQASSPAPYPGLVSVGADATGRVLVDLEAAHGVIAVTGPGELTADVLSAMATELATSLWSDEMHLTLVGFGEDVAVLAPDRVHLAATVADALPTLEAHVSDVSDVLATSDVDSVLAGRAEGRHPEAWVPHYLITPVPPSDTERERLLALTAAGHSLAAGYLVAGDMPGAAWTWEVTADGRLYAPQLGLDVEAQLIPHEQQEALAELFESADDLTGVPMSAPLDAAPATELVPDAAAPVEVTLLGPVCVSAAGEIEADRLPLATEIVVYLAAHPGGVHPNVLTAAIWPRGVTDEVRDAALARVRAWLGSDGIGRPHVAADASGRLRLGSGVRVDWHVFRTLIAQAEQAAGSAREEARLAQAMSLVAGPFLDMTERGRYAWIVTDGLEYEVAARVGDAAHRLCELRLAGGNPEGAMDAARAGLRLVDDEQLWRDLLTAGHATGQEHLLRAAASEVWASASLDGHPPAMAPETEALMDELLPTWRWTLA
jgi:nucleoid-associated protein YgaU